MVGLGRILGIFLVLSLFLGLTGAMLLVDGWWKQEVIEPMKYGSWGESIQYFLFTMFLVFMAAMVFAAVVVQFISGATSQLMWAAGPATAATFNLLAPLWVATTIGFLVIGYFLADFIILHLPMVAYFAVILSVTVKFLKGYLSDFFNT